MDIKKLPFKNLKANLGRTCALAALVALLALIMLGSLLIIASMRNGLASLEERLGADIIVVPNSARSQYDLEQIILDGVPGTFYMDKEYVQTLAQVAGVEQVSPQYYLASADAGCCDVAVQIIGIDPATDFTIQPWIDHSYSHSLGQGEVLIGAHIDGAPGTSLTFFGVENLIVAKLDETGTALDNAVFCTEDTITSLIAGAQEQHLGDFLADAHPGSVVSMVQIKVADDAEIQDVTDDINLHVRGVSAVAARSMTATVANSMAGAQQVVGILAIVIWVLAAAVLLVAFWLFTKARKQEFAVLRVLGASQKQVAGVCIREAYVQGVIGALAGIVIALLVVFTFAHAIEEALNLPFLVPSIGAMTLFAVATLVVATIVSALASALAAGRLSRRAPGQLLREE